QGLGAVAPRSAEGLPLPYAMSRRAGERPDAAMLDAGARGPGGFAGPFQRLPFRARDPGRAGAPDTAGRGGLTTSEVSMSELGVIEERARQTPVVARPDVLVVGGGSAGIAAACAAARTGARTMLVERYGFLGGTLTAVTLGGFCGGYGLFGDELREVVGGFYRELVERLRARDAVHSVRRIGKVHTVPYDPSRLRLVLDETLDAQGVDLLLHTQVVDVVHQGSVVEAVIVANKAGRGAIVPRMVIDCSGDGDVAFLAGAEFVLGDGKGMQYASSMFRMLGV